MVLPVPGLPRNTRWRDRGGTGRPSPSRSLRTFTKLMRLFTSAFTCVRPHSSSSWAISSSTVGSGSFCSTGSSGFSGTPCAGAGRAVTKSFASRGVLPPARPSLSQRLERTSAQRLTNPASPSLTTPSTAANRRAISVKRSMNRRASPAPATLSQARIRPKLSGGGTPGSWPRWCPAPSKGWRAPGSPGDRWRYNTPHSPESGRPRLPSTPPGHRTGKRRPDPGPAEPAGLRRARSG